MFGMLFGLCFAERMGLDKTPFDSAPLMPMPAYDAGGSLRKGSAFSWGREEGKKEKHHKVRLQVYDWHVIVRLDGYGCEEARVSTYQLAKT